MFFLVNSNQDGNAKSYKGRRYHLPKGIIKNCNVIINGKHFYNQTIDSHIKGHEEMRKLATGQCEDYTTG